MRRRIARARLDLAAARLLARSRNRTASFETTNRSSLASTDSSLGNYAARDPDVRLMLEVRDGSATAFEELMLRYQNRVMTVL